MIVFALSKAMFNRYMAEKGVTPQNVEDQDIAFISINNQDDHEAPYFPENKKNVKVMVFADIDQDTYVPLVGTGKTELVKAFTMEQARELYGFIKVNMKRQGFLVHCTAGVARSGAVATFINDFAKGSYSDFIRKNPSIQPNTHVLQLLRKAHEEDLLAEFEPFWLETNQYFGFVNKIELDVIRHLHPDFEEFLDAKHNTDDTQVIGFGFGHGYNGTLTLRQWLKEKNMLHYFTDKA